jgi:hypothetical protein
MSCSAAGAFIWCERVSTCLTYTLQLMDLGSMGMNGLRRTVFICAYVNEQADVLFAFRYDELLEEYDAEINYRQLVEQDFKVPIQNVENCSFVSMFQSLVHRRALASCETNMYRGVQTPLLSEVKKLSTAMLLKLFAVTCHYNIGGNSALTYTYHVDCCCGDNMQ